MFCDFVRCTNCGTEEMNIKRGEEICPLCGAIGTLSWVDDENPEVEVSDSEILNVQPHIYHPGHDAYEPYQCSSCGLIDFALSNYTRKESIIISDDLNLEDISSKFIEKDDDGFLKFYKLKNNFVDYVELCPQAILENIVKLYGNEAEYNFSIKQYEGKDFFVNIEYVLDLNVFIDGKSFVYEIYSTSVPEDLQEIKKQFFNQILK